MSDLTHTNVQHLRVRSSRLIVALCILVLATAAVIYVTSYSSPGTDSTSAGSTVSPAVQSTSGPNEDARGQATATSAGSSSAPSPGGGPNEAARGQSAATASQP